MGKSLWFQSPYFKTSAYDNNYFSDISFIVSPDNKLQIQNIIPL